MKRFSHKSNVLRLLVAIAMAHSACIDPPPVMRDMPEDVDAPEDLEDQGPDAVDMPTPLTPDMAPPVPDMDVCVPRDVCPPDACGSRSDGCGGQLDCGPCVCTVEPGEVGRCGPCGLGQETCVGDVGQCAMPDVPEQILEALRDSCEEAILYVDPARATGEDATGSRESPFATLDKALEIARSRDIRAIVLSRGDHVGELAAIPDGTSLLGGFGADFIFDPTSQSELRFTGRVQGSFVAMLIEGNQTPLALTNLVVRLVGSGNARHRAAIKIKDSKNVWLSQVDGYSGDGSRGVDGITSLAGEPGTKGGDAGAFAQANTNIIPSIGRPAPQTFCDNAEGGAGGLGAPMFKGYIGNPGMISQGGAEGGAGGSLRDSDPSSNAGGMGSSGNNGMNGAPGRSGSADLRFRDGELLPIGDGSAGEQGQAGVGGGGGGGAAPFSIGEDTYTGGSGGAGGSGGCGGAGGGGGQSGQSSFGLLVSSSNSIFVTGSYFEAGVGGRGGAGGQGGRGGEGGARGLGTLNAKDSNNMNIRIPEIFGGHGGAGGRGGDGGRGGAGVGGASIGALCEAPITLDDQTTFKHSEPGEGGAPNLRGVSALQFGCMR